MKERYLLTAFVIFISFASACASYCGTYSCPRTFDPPDRTRCCLWSGRNSCCRPGGNTCSDNYKHVRNYCPGPDDENEKVCCTVNNKPKCCSTLLLLTIILPVIAVAVLLPVIILVSCCCCSCCPLAQRRQRRQMQHAGAPYPGPSGTAMSLGPQGYGNQYNQQRF